MYNCGEWEECMGVASGCGEQEEGVASGRGWNLWQARRKQLSIGPAGRNERAKQPLGCLGHAYRKIFWISDLLRSFLVQFGEEIA